MSGKPVAVVTGGAGFIGSHTCLDLAARGHQVVIADNFDNSSPRVVPRLEELAGVAMSAHKVDVRDREALSILFKLEKPDAVIHFAGLKAVAESVAKPFEYFDQNIGGSIVLLGAMRAAGVRHLIFSSSCTVYGNPSELPVAEHSPKAAMTPYGLSKLTVERMLEDLERADPDFRYASLRYFNPVGAHPSGRIGEDPRGVPNNLMPLITQAAVGRRSGVKIFGGDWNTPDGTCVRDYIHVSDVARAHVNALDYIVDKDRNLACNLGVGKGTSVLELVQTFERVTGQKVPHEIVERRPGDIAAVWADPSYAERELAWKAQHDLETMCRDAWRWQSANPNGYEG
jgi:UDP-glucose 4-epimerase